MMNHEACQLNPGFLKTEFEEELDPLLDAVLDKARFLRPETRILMTPETRNPKPGIRNTEHVRSLTLCWMLFSTRQSHYTQDPQPETRNLEPGFDPLMDAVLDKATLSPESSLIRKRPSPRSRDPKPET